MAVAGSARDLALDLADLTASESCTPKPSFEWSRLSFRVVRAGAEGRTAEGPCDARRLVMLGPTLFPAVDGFVRFTSMARWDLQIYVGGRRGGGVIADRGRVCQVRWGGSGVIEGRTR